jgi:spore coat polysaccharide biosynthesis protein SpsF
MKILKDLNGKTVIERVIERAKQIRGLSEIILCTSPNQNDKPLIDIAKKNNIPYFLGHEDDVFQRLYDAATTYTLDYYLGITADNPLFSIQYSNQIIDIINKEKYDYIRVEGLPLGTATYGINTLAAATVCKVKTVVDTEIWGELINRPEIFNVFIIRVEDKLNRPDLRLTLDYQEDYDLLQHLYTTLSFNTTIDLEQAINYLNIHPEIAQINQHCIQRDLHPSIKNKINRLYTNNIEEIQAIKNDIYSQTKK